MLGNYSVLSIVIFTVGIFICLLIDLFAHKDNTVVSAKSAAKWVTLWVSLAAAFSIYIYISHGKDDFMLFVAGYLLEESLSIDNLFVMAAVFTAFGIPDKYQHRVLFYGIIGAWVLRILFIMLGASLLNAFGRYALIAFGVIVLFSAIKMWLALGKKNESIEDYSNHWSIRMMRRLIPVHPRLEGNNFFFRNADGKMGATPLFLCLIAIEMADVVFAFDSVPAILGITNNVFLVYTSNIFAILGLRSMYFFLAAARRAMHHLDKAVIAILAFIGLKMLADAFFNLHIPVLASLGAVISCLILGVLASLILPQKE